MKIFHQMNNRQIDGFTLIEMLVVVVIIGVLAAIAGPSWLSFLTQQRMSAVNSDLASVLRDVQTDATQQRSARRLTISPTGTAPSVTVSDPITGGGVELYSKDLGSDASELQLSALERNSSGNWVTASSLSIDFDYSGNASSASGVPYIIQVQPQVSSPGIQPKCVIITTLLGSLKMENSDTCNTFSPD